jgi:hypothetical protein
VLEETWMPWNKAAIDGFASFSKTYVSSYDTEIDCADLALSALVDYATAHKLPVRLRYFAKGKWDWYAMPAGSRKSASFKSNALKMLGALNVIDNTRKISLETARAGDMIMTRWSPTLGHTRIIDTITLDPGAGDYRVVWYQGNLPPVVPQRRSGLFAGIGNVFENAPRRWKFSQFDA